MFNIGDNVRVIPNSYIALAKHYFNYRDCWNFSTPEIDEKLMLGGTYKILSKNFNAKHKWYVLLKNNINCMGQISEDFLINEEDFNKCKFKIGEKLKFNPTCTDSDKQYLSAFNTSYSFDEEDQIYEVTHILNNYYIFLKYPKESEYAYPFRWIDFKKL
jgi:hypothetical protein